MPKPHQHGGSGCDNPNYKEAEVGRSWSETGRWKRRETERKRKRKRKAIGGMNMSKIYDTHSWNCHDEIP
jgi:hypothetical protein